MSYAYITATVDFDSMPDELFILLVKEADDQVYSHVCPFNTILITGDTNLNVLGRYYAENPVINEDCLLYYRKYIKDKSVTGEISMYYAQQEKTVYYHSNPYFSVDTISDDETFLARVSLPV